MKKNYHKTTFLLILTLLTTSGCVFTNPQSTNKSYAPGDGIETIINDVALRALLIVSKNSNEPGILLGSAVNESSATINLKITQTATQETKTFTIPANETLKFGPNTSDANTSDANTIFANIKNIPGALETLTFSVNGKSEKLQIPILDNSLEQYQQYYQYLNNVSENSPTETNVNPTNTPTTSLQE